MGAGGSEEERPKGKRLLRRAERREQIIGAATRSFGRSGFAATSLEDVAVEAGISKVIIYRHFESKVELYRVALEHIAQRLELALGGIEPLGTSALEAMLRVAHADPDGFQLLFRHAAREPEFRSYADELRDHALAVAEGLTPAPPTDTDSVADTEPPDPGHRRWAAELVPRIVNDAIVTWLTAGQPGTVETATATIRRLITDAATTIHHPPPAPTR